MEYIGTGASGGIKYMKSGYVGFGRLGTYKVFGEETAKATASAAVVSGGHPGCASSIGWRKQEVAKGCRQIRHIIIPMYYIIIFRDLAARLCRKGGVREAATK